MSCRNLRMSAVLLFNSAVNDSTCAVNRADSVSNVATRNDKSSTVFARVSFMAIWILGECAVATSYLREFVGVDLYTSGDPQKGAYLRQIKRFQWFIAFHVLPCVIYFT